jgi:hypothetical protein
LSLQLVTLIVAAEAVLEAPTVIAIRIAVAIPDRHPPDVRLFMAHTPKEEVAQ